LLLEENGQLERFWTYTFSLAARGSYLGRILALSKAVTVPESMSSIDNEFVSKSYQDATDYLKANYSFLYIQNSEEHMATWKVSTWFRKTRPSEVRAK
jgi:hypothetical protein